MKEMTESERRYHLANCCKWKFDGYTIDDEGMPKDCTLVNETNPYLPKAVQLFPKRTCHLEPIPYAPGEYEGMRCSNCKTVDLDMGAGAFCSGCGFEVVDAD